MAKRKTGRRTGQMYDPNELLKKTKLNKDEAAFLLDVTPRTVERYMSEGKLDYKRMPGGHRKPLTESVRKYL